MKVLLKYQFVIDPSDVFQTRYQFENVLFQTFRNFGYTVEIVDTGDDENKERMIILIKENTEVQSEEKPATIKTPQRQKADMLIRKDEKGRFTKPNLNI